MNDDAVYDKYWQRKQLLVSGAPAFPVRAWWQSQDSLCDIEQVYFDAIRHASSVLDVGAGDLRVMQRLKRAGLTARYDTQDIGVEFPYTFQSLDQVTSQYDAVLCLDVLEHLSLPHGLGLLRTLIGLLAPGGTLILQTPNARCIRAPLAWDMTHVHCYNAEDLWAFCSTHGLSTTAYRVVFRTAHVSWLSRARALLEIATTRILRCDYTDNIALVAIKPPAAAHAG